VQPCSPKWRSPAAEKQLSATDLNLANVATVAFSFADARAVCTRACYATLVAPTSISVNSYNSFCSYAACRLSSRAVAFVGFFIILPGCVISPVEHVCFLCLYWRIRHSDHSRSRTSNAYWRGAWRVPLRLYWTLRGTGDAHF